MARRRGRFRRRSSSPLPTGSFRSRMPSLKAFRENFCPRFIGCTRPRTIEPQTKRADRGRRRLLPVQKNIFRETLTTIRKSCLWFPTRATPNFQTNRIDCCSGISSFFPLSLFFPPSPFSFFVYNHLARRSRISRITRKRIIPRTKRGKRNRRNDFSLWARTKRFPFPVSLCLSLSLFIYIRIYIGVALIQRIIGLFLTNGYDHLSWNPLIARFPSPANSVTTFPSTVPIYTLTALLKLALVEGMKNISRNIHRRDTSVNVIELLFNVSRFPDGSLVHF